MPELCLLLKLLRKKNLFLPGPWEPDPGAAQDSPTGKAAQRLTEMEEHHSQFQCLDSAITEALPFQLNECVCFLFCVNWVELFLLLVFPLLFRSALLEFSQ